jgi:chaperonin GroES
MPLKPLGDGVVIERLEGGERVVGGIVLPNNVEENRLASQGIVIAVGPGLVKDDGSYVPVPLKEGDKVLFHKNGGFDLSYEGKKVKLIRLAEVLAQIVED